MAWPTAGLGGTLVAVRLGSPCFAVRLSDDTLVGVSWPDGFSARFDEPAELLRPDGVVVAREGEEVFVGGGVGRRLPSCDVGSWSFAAGPIDVAGKPRYGYQRQVLRSS
jgi:hypothetical protein